MSCEFTEQTHRILSRAGWSETRVVDTTPFEDGLQAEGYQSFPVVRGFLASFGAVTLARAEGTGPPSADRPHFDPVRAAKGVDPALVSDWARRIGDAVCPVGEAYWRHMTLVMSSRGAVYAGFEDTLIEVGANACEAIEHLCVGKFTREVA